MPSTILSVPGLHCGVCRSTVLRVLSEVPGVHGVDVDLRGRVATVQFDAGVVDGTVLCAVLARVGYPATQRAPNTGPTPAGDGAHVQPTGDAPSPGDPEPHGARP